MIQIDIPMPKNCGECPICNEYLMCGVPCNGRGWGENDVSDYFTNGRPEWCPLKEHKTGHWIFNGYGSGVCSECNFCVGYIYSSKYCQNCGAKMENGTD